MERGAFYAKHREVFSGVQPPAERENITANNLGASLSHLSWPSAAISNVVATVSGWWRERNRVIATPEGIEELRELQSRWDRVQSHAHRSHPDRATEEFEAARQTYYADPTNANLEKLLAFGISHRAVRDGLTAINTTVCQVQEQLGKVTGPVLAPFFQRVADHLDETAKEQEARERGDADRFSIDFVPSVTLTGLSNKVAHLRKKAADCANPRGYGGNSPRSELGDYIDGL